MTQPPIELMRVTSPDGFSFAIANSDFEVEVFADRKHVGRRLKAKAHRWLNRMFAEVLAEATENVRKRQDEWHFLT